MPSRREETNFYYRSVELAYYVSLESALPKKPSRRTRILIVDDSPTSISIVQAALGNRYDICTAQSGDEGLDRAVSEHPDLILLDIEMPGKNGIEVLKELRLGVQTRAIPVIMISSLPADTWESACHESGCNDYLVKPAPAERLLATIEKHLGH